MDELFEDELAATAAAAATGEGEDEPEATLASGVLTVKLPPHGTWVINKQTPNRQIWWSSPLSGPRRYEYENEQWVFTRSGDGDGTVTTLGDTLRDELKQLYQVEFKVDIE